jgi:hypothetical protein
MTTQADIVAELDRILDDWVEKLDLCDQAYEHVGYEACITDLKQYVETLRHPPPERDYLK